MKPPEDFFVQIPLLKKLVKALGWGFLECDDYEADDIIGTLAHQASVATTLADARLAQRTQSTSRSGAPAVLYQSDADALEDQIWDTVIVSSDLDMLQVVDDNTRMYRLLKGFSKLEEMDVPAVEEKYGIKKDQFLDLKALKGDASDNIPGVPGIGEKTAVKLLNEYGTLEGVYEHIDEITGAVQKKLIAGKDSAFMSYKLGKIYTDAPVSLDDIPDLVINPGRIERAFVSLEFNSLKSKFKAEMTKLQANKLTDFKISNETDTEDDFAEKEMEAEALARNDKIPTPTIDFSEYIIAEDVKQKMHSNKNIAEQILGGKKFWDLAQARFLLNPLARITVEEQGQGEFDFGDTEEDKQKKMLEANEQLVQMSQYPKLGEIYLHYDLPLIPVLYKMENVGVKISQEYFAELLAEYRAQVDKLENEVFELAGAKFNINSPVQLAQILFEKLQLPTKGIKKTARGYSTGAKELDKLKDFHPIISKIMEYREAAKLLSTYIMPLPGLADAEGRIHTTFTQNVTATGRLSSVSPNLQNIPVRSEEGRRIRTGFVADTGKKLVSADYSQFELRLAAVLSGDQNLIDDFNSGIDIHTKTASDVFQVPMEKVTKAQRRAAKTINFGVMYGMSAKGLADATGMTVTEAKQFIDDYFAVRKPIREYLDKVLKQAREEGYVETYYGRRRPTPDVRSANFMIRQGAERAAQNMPIQGTEADLMKRAMIRVDAKLPEGANLILQVHDSMIVECNENQVEEVSGILKETMEGIAPELPIKLAVEVTSGDNWGTL